MQGDKLEAALLDLIAAINTAREMVPEEDEGLAADIFAKCLNAAQMKATAALASPPVSDGIRVERWRKASRALGAWMSAALDDPKVCDAMKADITEWFSAGEPFEGTEPPVSDGGEDAEAAAWDWLESKFLNVEAGHDPNDRDYGTDDMVDAYIAGRAAVLAAKRGDGGEFVMVPREATEAMLDAAGLVDIEIYPTNVPSGLTATNRREARAIWKEMLAASPSRPSPSAEQREAALHAAVRATYPGRSLHADPIQDTERAYWNPLLDAILAALYPDRGE